MLCSVLSKVRARASDTEKYLYLEKIPFFGRKVGWGGRAKVLKKIYRPRAIFNEFDPP